MSDLVEEHKRIAIDTCIWIYHFAEHPEIIELTRGLLTAAQSGTCEAVVSDLSLLEILVHPLTLDRTEVADEYETLLINFPHLHLVPISRDILVKAARLRARYRLRTPDAIIVATAIQHNATRVVTNDTAWKRITEIDVVCLSDFRKASDNSSIKRDRI